MSVKQSNDPRHHLSDFQSSEMVGISYSPSLKERSKELIKQGKDAVCSLPEKKAFAITCLTLKGDIIKDIGSVDPSGNSDLTSQMTTIYSTWKSKTAIKNAGNKIHSPLLAKVIDIVLIIDDHLKERRGDSIERVTRHGAQVKELNLTGKQIFYRDIMDLRNRVDNRIRTSLNDTGSDSRIYLVKGLKLEPQMIGRGFDPSRVPNDPKIWPCAYCGCQSVIFVEEDDDCEERNEKSIHQYSILVKIWARFLEEVDISTNASHLKPDWPSNPFNGNKPMKRAPTEPKGNKIQSQRVLCTCASNQNINQNGPDELNGCISKCRIRSDPNDQRHMMHLPSDPTLGVYKWEGNPPQSTCPPCNCVCNKLYKVKDIPAIGLAIRQQNMRMAMGNGPTPETKLTQFLGQAMNAGRQAADDIEMFQQMQGSCVSQRQNEDSFHDSAAEYATRMSGSLSSDVIQLLQKNLPRGTKIILPGGKQLDTRVVTGNSDFHVRNNRISGVASSASNNVAPGMIYNLQVDYSQTDAQFNQAAMDPKTMSNVMASVGSSFFSASKSDPGHTSANLDSKLANELAAAVTPAIAIDNPTLVVYPFMFPVDESAVDAAAYGLTELANTSLRNVSLGTMGPSKRTNYVTITTQDKDPFIGN